MLAAIVLGTNYGGLMERGITFSLLLLLTTLIVGFTEEAIFRGIGVTTFRRNGYTEAKVALWTTILFGLAHSTNFFTEGPGAFSQVFTTIVAGYLFYLIRRRTGGLVAPAIVHGLWDFGLITTIMIPNQPYPGALLFILVGIALIITVLTRFRSVELPKAAESEKVNAAA